MSEPARNSAPSTASSEDPPATSALRAGFLSASGSAPLWFHFPGFWAASVAPNNVLSSQSERTAMAAGWGSAITGGEAIVSVKGVGLADACNEFLHAHLSGVRGALVVCVFDDIEVEGSQSQFDSRHFHAFFGGLWLEPRDLIEAFDFAYTALTASRRLGLPVVIRIVNSLLRVTGEIPSAPSVRASSLVRDIETELRSRSSVLPIVHPIYAERQLEALNERNRGCQWIADHLYALMSIDRDPPEQTSEIHPTTLPLPNGILGVPRGATGVIDLVEGPDPVASNILRAATGFGLVASRTVALDPRHATNYRISDAYESVFAVVRSTGMFVFGDLGTFTTDTAGTIDACLCLGAAPASALGYFLAHNRPVIAIIGDAAFMHSGVIGVYEIIRRQADVKVIIIDNGASVSTGGQITGDIDTVIGGLPSTLRLHIAETNISERLSCALAKPGPQIVAVRTT